MIRAKFEHHVDCRLGPMMAYFGFVLSPQTPGSVLDPAPVAIFGMSLELFSRRYSGFMSSCDIVADEVNLIITWRSKRILIADLEGTELLSIQLQGLGRRHRSPPRLLDAQLLAMKPELGRIMEGW